MSGQRLKYLTDSLFFFYALFIFGSTFSIALAQVALGFSLTLFLIIAIAIRYNPFVPSLKWFYYSVGLYFLWMFVSALHGATPLRSLFILKEDWLFCIVPIGIYLFQNERYRDRLMLAFAAGLLLISVYGLIQHFTGVHLFKETPPVTTDGIFYRVKGNFSHRLTFGNYYGTAALFMFGYGISRAKRLKKSNRTFFVTVSILAMIVAILTYSRGVIGGMAVVIVLAGIVLGRKHFLISLAMVAVAATVVWLTVPGLAGRFSNAGKQDLDVTYEGGRLFIWKNSLKIIRDDPVFGVGAGNFETAYASHLRPDIPDFRKHVHAHNDFINLAAMCGLPGFVLFAGLWVTVLRYFWVGWRRRAVSDGQARFYLAAFLGSLLFLATSLTEATFADEEVRQMLMFVWAAGLWPWHSKSTLEQTGNG